MPTAFHPSSDLRVGCCGFPLAHAAYYHRFRVVEVQQTFGWEPRGRWPREVIRSLCRELGLVHVVDPFDQAPVTFGPRYFRLHGIGGYHYRYTGADLRRLLALCRGTTYTMFNNSAMAEDAARFQHLAPNA